MSPRKAKSRQDWKTVKLTDVMTVIRGVTYKKEHASKEPKPGLLPILRANNIQNGLVFEDLVYVPKKCVSEIQLLRFGDIIIAASSGSRHIVGKAAQLKTDWSGSFGTFCFGLRPKPEVHSGYLSWFLQTSEYRHQVSELSAGVNINNLRAAHVEEIPIPLPPLPEQRRIVAEIEKQFSRLEEGVSALKRVQANLKRYRAAVLKAACEGRLVETEAELYRKCKTKNSKLGFESGEQLLKHILDERRKTWKGRGQYKEPAMLDPANWPKLPEGWTWASIGSCFHVSVGATPSRKEASYWGGEFPWVSSGEVRFRPIVDTRESITREGLENSSTQLNPKGSVLLGMIGEGKTRGQTAVLKIDACNNQNCAAIRVSETPVPPEFVYYWLWSQYDNTRRTSSGNNQPALNKQRVESMVVPIPPLAEQKRIVEEVERRLSVVDELESLVTTNLQRASRLRQSILQKAFEGELT
jgi:type I restriction enzyme S subunit